jgi:bacterioferritin (cytochrome b1)
MPKMAQKHMERYIKGIDLYESHKDLNTVKICVKSLKDEISLIQPLLDEVELIKMAIQKGESIIEHEV